MTESVRVLVEGEATGPALVLDRPLSFWGGFDAATGSIIDHRHPQAGASVSGTVLVMEAGRGSSSASSVLAEAVRLGTAPAAVVMLEADEIVALGAFIAGELYGIHIPVVVADRDVFRTFRTGEQISVRGGTIARTHGTT